MNICVGNLSYTTSEDILRDLFGGYGTVAAVRVITDKFSGKSKGFAFVEMPDRAAPQPAIDATNGQDLMGRRLRVNESQPRPSEDRPSRDGGRRRF